MSGLHFGGETTNMGKLAEVLRELRGTKSLREVSKRAGISHNYLRNLEIGIDPRTKTPINPSPETLKKLSDAYNYPYEELLKLAGYLDEKKDAILSEKDVDSTSIPAWATKKDVRDFKKMLEEDVPIMFDGVPLDDEDREKILRIMEAVFWDAKKRNKRKPIEE
jgi:transcriptional regulator with XRE-family HTH domain